MAHKKLQGKKVRQAGPPVPPPPLPRPANADQEYYAAILAELREINKLLAGEKSGDGEKKPSLMKNLRRK